MKKFIFLRIISFLIFFTFLSCEEENSNKITGEIIQPSSIIKITIPSEITVGGISGVLNPEKNSVLLEWTKYNSSATSGYKITVSQSDPICSCPSTSLKSTLIVTKDILNKKINNLNQNLTYFVKIEAIDANNQVIPASISSNKIFVTQGLNGLSRPTPPSINSVLILRKSIEINWQKSTDLVDTNGNSMKYNLTIKDSTGKIIQIYPNLNATTLQKNISGLTPNSSYLFELSAVGTASGSSDIISTNILTKPNLLINSYNTIPGNTEVTIDDRTADKVALDWSVSNAIGNLKYDISVNGTSAFNQSLKAVNSTTITGLLASTPLYNIQTNNKIDVTCIDEPENICERQMIEIKEVIRKYNIKIKITDDADNEFIESTKEVTMNFKFQ